MFDSLQVQLYLANESCQAIYEPTRGNIIYNKTSLLAFEVYTADSALLFGNTGLAITARCKQNNYIICKDYLRTLRL